MLLDACPDAEGARRRLACRGNRMVPARDVLRGREVGEHLRWRPPDVDRVREPHRQILGLRICTRNAPSRSTPATELTTRSEDAGRITLRQWTGRSPPTC